MHSGHDLDRARDALQFIPPDLPRDEWLTVGMAAHAAGLQFDDFNAWSAAAGNYSERDARDTWRSFKPGKGIGAGTLFKVAADHGRRREGAASHGRQTRPAQAPARPVEPPKAPRPGMGAGEVWGRCKPAPPGHGYIVKKDGRPDGLRVLPEGDPLRVNGESVAGCLVVPVLPLAGGEPVSLQFIAPPDVAAQWKAKSKTDKPNLPGASMAGGAFIVGELVPGGTAYLCEGIGQAWACWKATGCAAVVCFGWGRVRAVAADLRQRDASARLVLVPDVGKEAEAETIAREVGALFVTMPEGWPMNADVNDMAQRDGADILEVLLLSASEPAKPEPRFKLLTRADLHALPPLEWRVRGVLPAVGVAALFGPSASGKSFLGFDLAAYIAEGRDWFGRRVKAAPVVYLALEGEAGFRLRAEAWEQANGSTLPPGLRLVLQGFKLAGDVPDLAAAIVGAVGVGAVVFVDTLNASAPGMDENGPADAGLILESAKVLQRLTAGLVVLVHHTGKDASKGMRGHSSLFAAMDGAIEVTRDGDRREWKVAKSKDGADGEAHPFRLELVNLAPDDEGEPVTSCVVRRDESPENATRSRLPKGGNQKVVLDALGDLLRKSADRGKAGAPPQRPCVDTEAAVDAIAPRLTVEPLRRKERARHALTGLVAAGLVMCREGWLWLP